MITHYLTLALRNLWKYRTQNAISIIGLAVGLLCFSYSFYINRFMGSIDAGFDNYRRIAEVTVFD
ncbi:MAG: hypothetical protein LBL78_04280, partial [Prevotellaceae bacterium]|nr:hypothetical protein [Prevotellaceae bacterium]